MCEKYTRQSLPSKYYRELLGSAVCVFNSNNAFIIENILRCDDFEKYSWYELIDMTSGQLRGSVHNVISTKCGGAIENLFVKLIHMRNRIFHSFRITSTDGQQILATKEKVREGNRQFEITEEYLLEFIEKNQELSNLLYKLRGY